MMVTLDAATATVSKVATTAAEAERLDREAAVLAVARHPGIVQLTAARPKTIEVRAVTGWCLADIAALRPAEVAGIGSAIATILADLHDVGIVHGGLEASHVLIASNGRPVLCSLGRGRLPRSDTGPEPEDDAVALIAILSSRLSPVAGSDGGLSGLSRALRPCRRFGIRQAPTARQLAARLAAVPGATLPEPGRRVAAAPGAAATSPPRPSPPLRWRGVGLAVGAAAVLVAALGFGLSGDRHRRPGLAGPPPACPQLDRGCGPVDHRDRILVTQAGHFQVGNTSNDRLVLGRWTCGPLLPALLRVDQGDIWVWDRWPSGAAVAKARLAGRSEGAKTLRVTVGPSGCDHLSVVGQGGATTTVAVTMS